MMSKFEAPVAPDGCTYWCDGHLCDRTNNHCDQCMCRCGHRWTREQPHSQTEAADDQPAGQVCGFLWPDEQNPNGSDHKCGAPIHTGLDGEHRCGCGATRPVTLHDVPPGMAETTSLSDLAKGQRTYVPTERDPGR
jgi:hypothetical protein